MIKDWAQATHAELPPKSSYPYDNPKAAYAHDPQPDGGPIVAGPVGVTGPIGPPGPKGITGSCLPDIMGDKIETKQYEAQPEGEVEMIEKKEPKRNPTQEERLVFFALGARIIEESAKSWFGNIQSLITALRVSIPNIHVREALARELIARFR